MSPALSITDNMFMGRELRKPGFRASSVLRQLDHKAMEPSPATSSMNSG
jgi:fructose transport system ATP-binding protein